MPRLAIGQRPAIAYLHSLPYNASMELLNVQEAEPYAPMLRTANEYSSLSARRQINDDAQQDNNNRPASNTNAPQTQEANAQSTRETLSSPADIQQAISNVANAQPDNIDPDSGEPQLVRLVA